MERTRFSPIEALRFVVLNQNYDPDCAPGTDNGFRLPPGMDEAWKVIRDNGKEVLATALIERRLKRFRGYRSYYG